MGAVLRWEHVLQQVSPWSVRRRYSLILTVLWQPTSGNKQTIISSLMELILLQNLAYMTLFFMQARKKLKINLLEGIALDNRQCLGIWGGFLGHEMYPFLCDKKIILIMIVLLIEGGQNIYFFECIKYTIYKNYVQHL